MIPGVDPGRGRKPEIMADAAHWVLTQPSKQCTGNFFIDEDVLRKTGVSDFTPYRFDPKKEPAPDVFLD